MRPFAVLAPILLTTPALAHEGAHLHPHGIDTAWLVLGGALAGALAVALIVRARK